MLCLCVFSLTTDEFFKIVCQRRAEISPPPQKGVSLSKTQEREREDGIDRFGSFSYFLLDGWIRRVLRIFSRRRRRPPHPNPHIRLGSHSADGVDAPSVTLEPGRRRKLCVLSCRRRRSDLLCPLHVYCFVYICDVHTTFFFYIAPQLAKLPTRQ